MRFLDDTSIFALVNRGNAEQAALAKWLLHKYTTDCYPPEMVIEVTHPATDFGYWDFCGTEISVQPPNYPELPVSCRQLQKNFRFYPSIPGKSTELEVLFMNYLHRDTPRVPEAVKRSTRLSAGHRIEQHTIAFDDKLVGFLELCLELLHKGYSDDEILDTANSLDLKYPDAGWGSIRRQTSPVLFHSRRLNPTL